MAGVTYSKLEINHPCLIYVNDVNHPTGWWWGTVTSIVWHEGGWGTVEATIAESFPSPLDAEEGARATRVRAAGWEGCACIKPWQNYEVYPADQGTQNLVRSLISQEERARKQAHDDILRLTELRGIIERALVSKE